MTMYVVKVLALNTEEKDTPTGADLAIIDAGSITQITHVLRQLYPEISDKRFEVKELASLPERMNIDGAAYYPLGTILNIDY